MEQTTPDPLSRAAQALLGVNYLFPWQRLVISNILEAAEASGLTVNWPEGDAKGEAADLSRMCPQPVQPREPCVRDDSSYYGREIVILPTGGGKSLCFQLPALLLPRPTLVLFPILSLMADQERRLREKGFSPAVLRGGQSREERGEVWHRIQSGQSRFIIANPEVLLTETVFSRLGELNIAHVVIDEAHCVSEWGESFRPGYLRVGEIIAATEAPLVTAFTATASPEVLDKIDRWVFQGRSAHRIVANPDRPNISYEARGAILKDAAVRDLVSRLPRPAIVFCSSRVGTEKLSRYLRTRLGEREIRFYHAGLAREEKDRVEKWFFASRDGVLVSTCAFGLGVDKADVRTVIHRDIPPTVEAYLQESGRAGRDGKESSAVLIFGPGDESRGEHIPEGPGRERFRSLLTWARDAKTCRREGLLALLGVGADSCSGCDVCAGTASSSLREETSLLDFIARNKRALTLSEAAAGLEKGLGKPWEKAELRTALRFLIARGDIRVLLPWPWGRRLSLGRRGKPRDL